MISHPVIAIGASAGGIEALTRLVSTLPRDFPASILVVIHFPATSPSVLPRILQKAGTLPAKHAMDGESLEPGKIYIAQLDSHLILDDSTISLGHGPREHGFRPAIDSLFRTAARIYKTQVIGVVLSGTMGDGVAGLRAIKRNGGVAIVQDPEEAKFSFLPNNAIENVDVDYILPVKEIAQTLIRLVNQNDRTNSGEDPMEENQENEIIQQDKEDFIQGEDQNTRTVITCPDCGGVLWEMIDGNLVRYRCHEGHEYTSDSLLEIQSVELEQALWTAVRMLTERDLLLKRLGILSKDKRNTHSANHFFEQARNIEVQAGILRKGLERIQAPNVEL